MTWVSLFSSLFLCIMLIDHGALVSAEDDYSGALSDSSSHCISPPPGYTDVTPEHTRYAANNSNSLLSSSGGRDYPPSPTSDITSPANSEFHFYDPQSVPRMSIFSGNNGTGKRSSG